MNHFFARHLGALLLLFAFTGLVFAEENSGAGTITLRESLARAAESNPGLKALAYELRISEGRREQAGLRPNPRLSLELENFPGSGEFADGDGAEITLALSQIIELGDKRQLRVGVEQAGYGVVESDIAIRRLDLAAEVLRRFIRALGDQEFLAAQRLRLELAEQTLATVESRVKAARSPVAELHRARAARDRALLDERRIETDLLVSLHRLSALWGETQTSITAVKADLLTLPAVSDFDQLLAATRESADVQSLLSEARMRDAELRLAEAQRRPDVTLGAGIRRLEQTNDVAMVFSVELPLALYDRNQGNIRAAQARREQADAVFEARLNQAQAELFGFHQQLLQARAQTEFLRGQVLPELELALQQTQVAYERGRYSYLELADAQRNLMEVREAIIDSATRYHGILAEIERITGQPMALPAH